MAKHVILEAYTFTPSARSIVVYGKNIRREQLLLITNVTQNKVIYNFSDPNLTATSYTNSASSSGAPGQGTTLETTTIILNYNTTAMSSTDKLAILVEETYHEITPAETQLDPVGKMRVSEPQSLIDTDFEYGIQPTKWESIGLIGNRPTAFYNSTGSILVSNITGSYLGNSSVLVTTSDTVTPNLYVGSPIFVQGTLDTANADGWYVIETLQSNTSFTYRTVGIPQWTLFDSTKSYVFSGSFYSNSSIVVNNIVVNANTIVVNTVNPHMLTPGNGVWILNTSSVTGLNGVWSVATTPTSNTFTANGFLFSGGGSQTATLSASGTNNLFNRHTGYVQHRAFDGGVQFTNQTPWHNSQFIRQTRRYFRYQSGKGVQFSTGSILKPSIVVDTIVANTTALFATVTSKVPHGLGVGANIIISGANDSQYNGTFNVTGVLSQTQFTYNISSVPNNLTATGFPITVSPNSWYGSRNRLGMFDEQNGFFFEFDGQQLYCVKRSSTTQISGTVNVQQGSALINGVGTKFSTQLTPGDRIVIRGTSYLVVSISSDTQLWISPDYRGITATNCLLSKTIDAKYPQSTWNIDRCDGTGASLYNIDLTRMQMFYADFTWYGAGAVRFGFKNNRGEVIYCHRIMNNNVNTEAYMRSGNLPARYETSTQAPYTILTSTLTSAATSINVLDASSFPSSGTVAVSNTGINGAIEYITYSSKTANVLTISTRAVNGGVPSANTFTYQANVPIQVSLYSPTVAATISHWGSSVIMDGKYDDDKSLIFNVGQNSPLINLIPNTRYAMISLRASPSVDNGFTGLLGAREINNRMQLVPRQMDVLTTAPYRIDVVLNGTPAQGFWSPVGGSSLAQYCLHANATPIIGGESMFSFFTSTAGQTQQDMSLVRDIGTSILSGGLSWQANTYLNKFPDGPDMITICATALAPVGNINTRISWTEAQA
jgi:hypothetical protein